MSTVFLRDFKMRKEEGQAPKINPMSLIPEVVLKIVTPSFHLRTVKSEFEEGMSGHLNFLKNTLVDFNVQPGLRITGRVKETN